MAAGMAQDRLALEAGLDQSGLSKFERGKRGFPDSALRRIAEVLKIPLDDLIGGLE